jgi:rare lipoprotein A
MKIIFVSAYIVFKATVLTFGCQEEPFMGKVGGSEEGTARYYAANLKGKITSFGEKYDDAQLTASHSRYPLNTLVKVTNLDNNLSVQVRINDYCKCEEEGKVINLSKEAASRLGMIASGKAKVRLEIIAPPSPDKVIEHALENVGVKAREVSIKEESKEKEVLPMSSSISVPPFSVNRTYDITGVEKTPKGFGIQVTALSNLNMVQDMYDELLKMGVKKEEIYIQVAQKDANKVFRLVFGEFYTKEAAAEKVNLLSQHGYKGVIRSHYNL